MLETKLWHNKPDNKNIKVAKMVEFIKTCDQYPCRFNFGIFFQFDNPPSLSAKEKIDLQKTLFKRNGKFPSAWWVMIKIWGRVLLKGMIKNEQIQFLTRKCHCQ